MPNDDPHPSSGALRVASHRGRLSLVLLALALASVVIVGVAVSREEERPPTSHPSTQSPSIETTTTAAASNRTEIESRLREILRLRDKAIIARDAELLSDIYTVDCKCLKDGRSLIQQLHKEKIVWKGVQTSITIQSAEEINDRLWIVVADIRTPPVRIETEAGKLVRVVAAERNLVRFALAKPDQEKDWLLGHASAFE